MRYAADFRAIARDALRGKWIPSVLTAFVAGLIGANLSAEGSASGGIKLEGKNVDLTQYFSLETINLFRAILLGLLAYVAVAAVVQLVISGAAKLGYARYNLNLVDGKEARFGDLFSQFHRLGDGFLMNLLIAIYTFLWSLLFVIPGIVKSFSYAMTPYILAEHPEYGVNTAITFSREMMHGNKFRLFCLNLSFIGWNLLCALPAGIAVWSVLVGKTYLLPLILVTMVGSLFLSAYMEAAQAAFYREVSGTECFDFVEENAEM